MLNVHGYAHIWQFMKALKNKQSNKQKKQHHNHQRSYLGPDRETTRPLLQNTEVVGTQPL